MQGQVAFVTGGASGIGRALCRALVQRAANVVVADINGSGAAAVARELDRHGPGSATSVSLDVTDARGFAEAVRSVHGDRGRLDLLFNNAGIGVGGPAEELALAHWERTIDVNLRGVVHGVRAAYTPLLGTRLLIDWKGLNR
jgi:NAD(P)-dependent dehydrogenase (short-subunit alcohol dehydrogenase family)